MRPPRLFSVSGLALGLILTHHAHAATLDYNVTFGSPPHTVGLPPAVGAGAAPRVTVSAIPFGTPQVVASQGALTTQPLRFTSADNQGDQIRIDLSDLPAHPDYDLQAKVLVSSMAPNGTFAFVFDTPTTRNLSFNAAGQITMVVPPAPLQVIGSYVIGQVMSLEVNIDLTGNHWDILIDGNPIHSGTFGGATQLQSVRMGTNVTANPPAVVAAIDDLVVTNGGITIAGGCNRLEFEDRPLGLMPAVFSFRTEGVLVHLANLQCPGQIGFSVSTHVVAQGLACGTGRELDLSQMAADFDFEGTVTDVTVGFRHMFVQASRTILIINGDCRVADDFTFYDGQTIGGVLVHAEYFGTVAQSCGMLTLEGNVTQLRVGGTSSFYLDNVSYCRACPQPLSAGFDNLALGAVFPVNTGFASGDASFGIESFFPPGATCVNPQSNGVAVVQNQGQACGVNRELAVNAVNVKTAFNPPLDRLLLNYGEYGGNVNLTINEVCRNVEDFADLSGSQIGDVQVWTADQGTEGQSCGTLYAIGPINQFLIGGQELVIDSIRACPENTTGVEESNPVATAPAMDLEANAPNPFQRETTIAFTLGRGAASKLSVYDVGGRLVRTLVQGDLLPGRHEVKWNGTDAEGSRVPSGIYLYRLTAGEATATRQLIVLR